MSRIDEYRRCAAAGMSKSETAEHCGVTRRSVGKAAERHGIQFVLWRDKPEVRQAMADRIRARNADPEFAAKRNAATTRRLKASHAAGKLIPKHLRALTPEERAEYDAARKLGCLKDEALRSIGRPDLVEAAE